MTNLSEKIELDRITISEKICDLEGGESLEELIAKYGPGLYIDIEYCYSEQVFIYLNRGRPESDLEYKVRLEKAEADLRRIKERNEKRAATICKKKEAALKKKRALYEKLKSEFGTK
jgi:hypothetical protein